MVDDDDDIRTIMGEIIVNLLGHEVLEAKDGPEAIELYRAEGYDCEHRFDAAVWKRNSMG